MYAAAAQQLPLTYALARIGPEQITLNHYVRARARRLAVAAAAAYNHLLLLLLYHSFSPFFPCALMLFCAEYARESAYGNDFLSSDGERTSEK